MEQNVNNTTEPQHDAKLPVIRWVASADRIPENRQKVLCYTGHRMIENSWCMHTDQDAEWFKRTFTHWTEDVLPPCV